MQQKGVDFVVANNPSGTNSYVVPISPKMYKEIIHDAGKVLKKTELVENFNFGLVNHDTPEWMRRRTLFSEFFGQENLRSLVPRIAGIIKGFYDELEESLDFGHENDYVSVDPTDTLTKSFINITETVLFDNSEDERMEINGHNIFHYVIRTFDLIGQVRYSLFTLLFFSLPYSYLLSPTLWYCKYREWKTEQLIGIFYENRLKNSS